jgi:hypothetical protein
MTEFLTDSELVLECPAGIEDGILLGGRRAVRPPHIPAAWRGAAVRQLNDMLALEPDWDGYGGIPPTRDKVASGIGFLDFVIENLAASQPHVSPTRTGNVLFAWEQREHQLEIELATVHAASYVYLNTQTGEEATGALFFDDADDGVFLGLLQHFAAP